MTDQVLEDQKDQVLIDLLLTNQEVNLHQEKDQKVEVLISRVLISRVLKDPVLTDRKDQVRTDHLTTNRVLQIVMEILVNLSQEVNLHQEKDQKEEVLISRVLKDLAQIVLHSTNHVLRTVMGIPVVSSQEVNLLPVRTDQEKDLKEEASISLALKDPGLTDLIKTDLHLIDHVHQTEILANSDPVRTDPVRIDQEVNLLQEKDPKEEVLTDQVSVNLVQKEAATHHVLSNQLLQTADTKSQLLKKKVISKR